MGSEYHKTYNYVTSLCFVVMLCTLCNILNKNTFTSTEPGGSLSSVLFLGFVLRVIQSYFVGFFTVMLIFHFIFLPCEL